ncbi:MAG: sigma-70 family RNA polymerase sigma factor [Bacteroides sp.]|nr:sigma-70 family RNA polymerase sigma factor [Bacteroides sp.]
MLQLWHSLERFDGRIKLSTWIYRIALNTTISFYRHENKHGSSRYPIDEQVISLPQTDPSLLEYEERLSFLYQFIEKQNELEKALLLLYLDGIRQSEISQIIGISETNVATRLSRLKQRIRKEYE